MQKQPPIPYTTKQATINHTISRAIALRHNDPTIPLRNTTVQNQSPLLTMEIDLLEKTHKIQAQPGPPNDRRNRLLLAYCEAAAMLPQVAKKARILMEFYIKICSNLADTDFQNGDDNGFQNVDGVQMGFMLEGIENDILEVKRNLQEDEKLFKGLLERVDKQERSLVQKRSYLENLKMLCGRE
ncbi:hypothetical protein SS50377_28273 [Spironucleus salmonicida]|uniref:Uncharacterized protein n=1 Tax=Spironucleus salmonicida TaxID=348837 RepID=V6LUZ4_9EUKA|nr:hypothetical protein SS50377_28273 [Spironucleus salmonicida]|eukprot:EST48452.1 Hypothetical protein SS50377_11401 [Spironucleus salmonicida]